MNWYKRIISTVTIEPFDYENTDPSDVDYDLNERYDQADMAFNKSKIRYDSSKNISHVAVENGQVIGAVASGWSMNRDYGDDGDIWVYSFDVAVDPQHRGSMAGIKLISEAIQYYEQTKGTYQEMGGKTMMSLFVVNERLIPILESKFKFQIESNSFGGCRMVRY